MTEVVEPWKDRLVKNSCNLNDYLECPVCLDVPDSEIYEIDCGHLFCYDCVSNTEDLLCPTCNRF